jgi:catechol 2,3-dioxygenase-like lactoylglutathione lyase family enzyme
MDATVRFYHGVLGMRLVATLAAGPMRHYFFEMGPHSTVAFFEWDGADVGEFEKPAGVPFTFPAQFDHVSFTVADQTALDRLHDRLVEHEVEVTTTVDHGFVRSIYFHDNNGIALEASWWVFDPTTQPATYGGGTVFTDADPVPAVRELADNGELSWLPSTRLAHSSVVDPA